MKLLTFALCLFWGTSLHASDLDRAIPSFTTAGKTAVPIDFQSVGLQLTFDLASQAGIGRCEIEFKAGATGYPLMDLVPSVRRVSLNGTDLGANGLTTVSAPDGTTKMRMLQASVNAGSTNKLEIEYTIPSGDVDYGSDGIRMVWAMSDVGADRNFLEKYACANLEFDRFPMNLRVEIVGNPKNHQVFTNGSLEFIRNGLWRVEFPDYFTSSSHYFHISHRDFSLAEGTYQGIQKVIPVAVYGSGVSVDNGLQKAKRVMAELEAAYGPYAHDSMTIYLTSSGGGMEHVGATITSLGALDHEITHSWFARGVMPSDGNSGWIDEAIASWRDNGYPRGTASLSGSSSNLASFSAYRRSTPPAAYTAGALLVSRFDSLFSGGMKSTLREVFSRAQRTAITTSGFRQILESITGTNVESYFQRYVYGGARRMDLPEAIPHLASNLLPEIPMISKHPRPLTEEEIRAIR